MSTARSSSRTATLAAQRSARRSAANRAARRARGAYRAGDIKAAALWFSRAESGFEEQIAA